MMADVKIGQKKLSKSQKAIQHVIKNKKIRFEPLQVEINKEQICPQIAIDKLITVYLK